MTDLARLIKLGNELLAVDRDVERLRKDCVRYGQSDKVTARITKVRRHLLCEPIRAELASDALTMDDLAHLRALQEIAAAGRARRQRPSSRPISTSCRGWMWLGADLLVADNLADAMMARVHLPESERRALHDGVLAEAKARATAELDGMYSVTAETAGLIRALQTACAIEAQCRAATPIGCDLRTAVWHLKRAAKAVQAAMVKLQVERDLAECDARRSAEFLATLDHALSAEVAAGRRAA